MNSGEPTRIMSTAAFIEERDNSLEILRLLARDWSRRLPSSQQLELAEEASIEEIRAILVHIRAALDSTVRLPPEANEDDHCKEALGSLLKDAYDGRQIKLLAGCIGVQYNKEDSDDAVITRIVSEVWSCLQEEDPSPDIYMSLFSVLNGEPYPPGGAAQEELYLKNWHCREVGGGLFEPRFRKLGELFTAAYARSHSC